MNNQYFHVETLGDAKSRVCAECGKRIRKAPAWLNIRSGNVGEVRTYLHLGCYQPLPSRVGSGSIS